MKTDDMDWEEKVELFHRRGRVAIVMMKGGGLLAAGGYVAAGLTLLGPASFAGLAGIGLMLVGAGAVGVGAMIVEDNEHLLDDVEAKVRMDWEDSLRR